MDRRQLATLLGEHFDVETLFSITPQFNRGILRRLNSPKLADGLGRLGLGGVSRALTGAQEKAGLGWTLMALARKKSA